MTREQTDLTAAAAVAVAYAVALDARDWAGFEALFEPEVEIDYGALGSAVATFAARAWTDRCRLLEMFDATHHKVTNLRPAAEGGGVVVEAYVDAAHFIGEGEGEGERVLEAYVLGAYRMHLVRRPKGWRIRRCVLTVAGYPGGRAAFDDAFAVARGRFAAKSTGVQP